MGKFIIEKDNEKFVKSQCICEFCTSSHNTINVWESYSPQTNLQKRMLKVISRIEKRERGKLNPKKSIEKLSS
jgi:hypothetical protein